MARTKISVRPSSVASKKNNSTSKKSTAAKPVKEQGVIATLQRRKSNLLLRRPHRSFRRTRRRDYERSLELPGYIAFSIYVYKTVISHKKLFGGLLLVYVIAGALLIGIASQDTYNQLVAIVDETADTWSMINQASLLLFGSLAGGLNPSMTEAQQVYSVLMLLVVWLSVVWTLRVILAGNTPRLRDALYSSGSPIVSTAVVLLIVVIQLLPAGLAIVGINAAINTGVFDSPVMSLIISFVGAGLILLSLYWIISSVFALIIVTLPGMYPWKAIQAAGDLVIGRRLRLLLRLIWMVVLGFVFSILSLLPVIVIDRLIKQAMPVIEWVPTVPIVLAVTGGIVLIWSAAYMYLLYRKVVEDDASPA